MEDVQVGDTVKAFYKTGTYIGKVKEDRGAKFLVEVLAVHTHPAQGDLHNPGQTEEVFFHQRKALSHHEKANVDKKAVHPFDGEIPEYEESLKQSVQNFKEKLMRRDTEFNQKALHQLEDLETQYFK
ncbi:kinase-associated lipoprotein B [Salimicrobium halophilum]|uniref:Kinase-associated protein B n=1 Tax=Salimicrobium halophilum TaxID=86666 RepID=A0A1G8VAR4_9BACI|nr:kinase-associated lipoprotein B [Salimicrobium halophilum]SDJ63158.1 kinase-associated protein B [Salimicrobium halophilum]